MNNISLIGFMGTGKTTIGKIIAKKMGFSFVDTDLYIEQHEGQSISEIFSQKGEKYFRKLESKALRDIIKTDNQVIATGGGIVLKKENLEVLLNNSYVIALAARPRTVYFRVKRNNNRPLLNTAKPLKKISKMMHERSKYYKKGHLLLNTDDINVEVIADYVIKEYIKWKNN